MLRLTLSLQPSCFSLPEHCEYRRMLLGPSKGCKKSEGPEAETEATAAQGGGVLPVLPSLKMANEFMCPDAPAT